MARTLTAQGLIQLPSLTAEETVTLATKLITTAESASAVPGNARAALDGREGEPPALPPPPSS